MVWEYVSERRQMLRVFCSGIGKTAVIYPAALLVATGMGTVILGIIFYASDVFSATPRQVGCLSATWSFCYIVGCLVFRPVSGRMLPRHSVLLATTLMSLCLQGVLFAESLTCVFVFYGLFGLSVSFFWPPLMGWLSVNKEGNTLNRAIGRFNISWSSGTVIGPILGGRLSEMDPGLPLRFGLLVFLGTALLLVGAILALSSLGQDDGAHQLERRTARGRRDGTRLRYPSWLGLFAAFAVSGAILSVFPLSAQRDLNLTKSMIGVLFFLRALFNTVTLGVMGRTTFWQFRRVPMVAGLACFGVATGCLACAHSVLVISGLLLAVGAFTAQSYANSLFHGVSGSVHRASRMAVHESLLSAGMVFGAIAGGSLYQAFGMHAVYLSCTGLLTVVAAGQTWFLSTRMGTNATG